jgi:hypothetical protein
MAKWIDAADAAKMMRKDLKAKFPGQKFKVKTDKYAGGASINVTWVDGPTNAAVKGIVDHYAGGTFDGQIDLMEYHTSTQDGEEVRFGSDFVFTNHHYSTEAFTAKATEICEHYGIDVPEIIEASEYSGASVKWDGTIANTIPTGHTETIGDLVGREIMLTEREVA